MSKTWPGGLIRRTPVTPSPTSAPGMWTLAEASYWVKQGLWPDANADLQWPYVAMLLSTTAVNGAQNNTFLDSSVNNLTITRNGNTTQGSFTPYNANWSNFFDNNGDSLSVPNNAAFDFGTGDFTVECWVYLTQYNSATYEPVFANAYLFYIGGTGQIILFDGSTNPVLGSAGDVPIGSWNHIAWVRSGSGANNTKAYVNGVLKAQGTVTGSIGSGSPNLIGQYSTNYFPGYISNVRVVKGTAVYTANFTPPTVPLTAISGTSLLTCQSNRFRDASSNNFTITRNGDVTVQDFSPFSPRSPGYTTSANGGSMYFDGTGDYLTAPYTTANFDWYTSGTDFTIEAWFYANTLTNTSYPNGGTQAPVLCGNRDPNSGTDYWSFGPTSEGIVAFYYFNGSAQRVTSTATVSAGAWTHIAMTKTSSGITLFVNGIAQTTTAISGSPQSSTSVPFAVGQGGSSSYSFPGYISGLRVVRGTAVYSGNFTPPTAPVTAITNTTILLNGTNAGIFDAATISDIETVGNAQVSTAQAKFGTTSVYFAGTGTYLSIPPKPDFGFGTGDFTVEYWVYPALTGDSNQVIVDARAADGPVPWLIGLTTGGAVRYYDGSTVRTGGTMSANTWHHVAWTRASGVNRVFLNGTQVSTYTATQDFGASKGLTIGSNVLTSAERFVGYLDELRITKGVARYTANFTPPGGPFPVY